MSRYTSAHPWQGGSAAQEASGAEMRHNEGTLDELGLPHAALRRQIAELVATGMLVWTDPSRDLDTIGTHDVLPIKVAHRGEQKPNEAALRRGW